MQINGDRSVREVLYDYSDRGRGPSLKETVQLSPEGLPKKIDTSGHGEMGEAVDESYVSNSDGATWRSAADSGRSSIGGFYLPRARTPEDVAVLARSLLRAPKRTHDMLPFGRASISQVDVRELTGPQGKAHVTLFAIEGVSFAPLAVWLDQEKELFAEGTDWVFTIRKGWEQAAPELARARNELIGGRARAKLRAAEKRPPGGILIHDVTLFDPERRALVPRMSVLVAGKTIERVAPSHRMITPQGATVINGRGRTLLPGLFDMHVHFGANPQAGIEEQSALHLASGVTSVRNMASSVESKRRFEGRARSGDVLPRIFHAGIVEGEGPTAAPTKTIVRTREEMVSVVDAYSAEGFPMLKIYSLVPPDLVAEAGKRAKARNMRVIGHLPNNMTVAQAVQGGFDEFSHVMSLLADLLPPPPPGTSKFAYVAARGGQLSLSSASARALVSLLAKKRIVIDPTLSLYSNRLTGERTDIAPALAPVQTRLPLAARREFSGLMRAKNGEERAAFARTFERMKELVSTLHRSGVRLAPGSDWIEGFTLIHELELYQSAGIPALDVLSLATLGSAKILNVENELGSIVAGKRADLILIDGNPGRDVRDLRKLELVIRDGALLRPETLRVIAGLR